MFRDYLYIDRPRLVSYAEQIGATAAKAKNRQWRVALGLTGPVVEHQQGSAERAANDHELAESVTRHLRKKGELRTTRPASLDDVDEGQATFVLETMRARKVIFTLDGGGAPRGLRELAVWVSNPLENPSSRDAAGVRDEEATGMFVYLLEGYWDDEPAKRAYSMMTALNVLLRTLRDAGAAPEASAGSDTSRDDYATPVNILVRNGGVKGDMRTVTALYRVRSVSENKIVNVGGRTLRCHDLFAYPLYVAAGNG
ncbi:hypothetical protein [Streptomyces sp. NPDC059909]|uniref:hypothetical protein n=1 Tax=Streptomyces sp. NPDC059909 TaxID=3346998 RepID=UPI00364AE52E